MRRPAAQKSDDVGKPGRRRGVRLCLRGRLTFRLAWRDGMGAQPGQRRGNFRHREHLIDHAGGDGASRHAVIGGFLGGLRDDPPTLHPYLLGPGAAIAAGSRQDDAYRAGAVCIRHRLQQMVERQPCPMARLRA